jgi:hypothetical protein
MEFKTEWLVKGLIESVFVVFSILLALAVDEWAANRDFAELANQSLTTFEQEITTNRDRVEDGLPYHGGIRDLLGQMMLTPPPVVDLRSIMEGLEAPVLLNTAWETALATGALTHMDFDVVRALSLTYSIQEGFTTRSRSDRPRVTGGAATPAQIAAQVQEAHDYVAALARDETELLTVYNQALELIGQHQRAAAGVAVDSTAVHP